MDGFSNSVFVNSPQCLRLGRRLAEVEFRPGFYGRPFLSASMPEELRMRMLWFSVVVCHQTYALRNKSLNLYGWDYLEYGFLKIAGEAPDLLDPVKVAAMECDSLADRLAPWFSPDGSVPASTLDRREERAALMIASARFLADEHQGQVRNFLLSTGNRLAGHPMAYYDQLAKVTPFADPLLKKATFLLKLLTDCRLMTITDPENIIPVMDYHMQRVLLRTGCVEVTDPGLFDSLASRLPLPDDAVVREASVKAMRQIAGAAGLSILLMNDIFYMLGRSCCLEEPLCVSHRCDKNPCSLTLTLHLPEHNQCLFAGICRGETDEAGRALWHPVVSTHFY